MEFEKLISVSGYGSLYKIISKTNFGLIAESMEDGKRMPVYQSTNVSTLGDISIYTNDGEISLKEVFLKVHEKETGAECTIAKGKDAEIKTYFETILPDYDKEKVYTSDVKKLLKWYNQLVKSSEFNFDQLKKKDEDISATDQDDKAITSEEVTEKKTTPKKEKKDETKKKSMTAKAIKTKPNVKNAPAKKVQTVRKSGGS